MFRQYTVLKHPASKPHGIDAVLEPECVRLLCQRMGKTRVEAGCALCHRQRGIDKVGYQRLPVALPQSLRCAPQRKDDCFRARRARRFEIHGALTLEACMMKQSGE